MMVDSAYFVKSTPLRSFTGYFQHCTDIVTDIWETCMRKFEAEFFFVKLTGMTASSN